MAGMSGLGRGLAQMGQNMRESRQQKKQEEDILKMAAGRGKALQNAFESLAELGVMPEGFAEKARLAQENMSPKEFIGYADQASKELSTLVQGGIHMQQINAQKAERERLARAMATIGATVGPTETGLSSGARFGGIATAQPRQASLQEMIQRIPTAGLEPGQAAALMNAMVNAQGAQSAAPDRGTVNERTASNGQKYLVNPATGTFTLLPSQAPQGFRLTDKGTLEVIPGGPADVERLKTEEAKAERVKHEISRADTVLASINRVLPKIDGLTAGFAGSILNKIPGTEAKDTASVIDAIRANIGFAELQAMRNASPTGGALGQIAVKELDFLQASLGNLSTEQSPKQLAETLKDIQKHYTRYRMVLNGQNPDEVKEAGDVRQVGDRKLVKGPNGWVFENAAK